MKITQIQIDQSHAKIGMSSPKGTQRIEQPEASVSMKQNPSTLNIRTTKGQLTIDQSQAFAAMNLKPITRLIRENASAGMQGASSGVQRVSSEGDALMKIENGGNPIADIAKRNAEGPEPSFNIGFVPPPFSVRINYNPGRTDIQFNRGGVEMNAQTRKPEINYTPQKVNIHMREHNLIRFSAIDKEI